MSMVEFSIEVLDWKKNIIRLSVVNPSVLQPLEKGGLTRARAGMKMTSVFRPAHAFFACNFMHQPAKINRMMKSTSKQ
jgi:hypothetical protein